MGKLEDLVVDENELDRETLGAGLAPYVRIGQAGGFRPSERWSALGQKGKIVAIVLAAKAAHVLGRRSEDALAASEIAGAAGVAGGTARPILRELAEARIFEQDQAKKYRVAAMNVPRALDLLK